MGKLKISAWDGDRRSTTHKVTGFEEGELYKLKMLPHYKAEEELIRILDERNENLGTRLARGYGILGLWFDNEAAYIRTGNSCD